MIYPEITCPYCRMQIGGYKYWDTNPVIEKPKGFFRIFKKSKVKSIPKFVHFDVLYNPEYSMEWECQSQQLLQDNVTNIDDHQNPTFNEDFSKKLEDLKNKFLSNPDDIDKISISKFQDFFNGFRECMDYGYLDDNNLEYDRESMKIEDIEKMYNEGKNLKEVLTSYLKNNDVTV